MTVPTANTLVNAPPTVETDIPTRVRTYSRRPFSSGASTAGQVTWKGTSGLNEA